MMRRFQIIHPTVGKSCEGVGVVGRPRLGVKVKYHGWIIRIKQGCTSGRLRGGGGGGGGGTGVQVVNGLRMARQVGGDE